MIVLLDNSVSDHQFQDRVGEAILSRASFDINAIW
jgi:hypothetical protein